MAEGPTEDSSHQAGRQFPAVHFRTKTLLGSFQWLKSPVCYASMLPAVQWQNRGVGSGAYSPVYANGTPPTNSWDVPHCVEPQIKARSCRVSQTLVAKIGAARPNTVVQRDHPECLTCHLSPYGSVRSLCSGSTSSSFWCNLRGDARSLGR